jgi:hypothetical protein
MAKTLQSPGVQVSVINESFYTPAAPGTVPLIFVATAQDKSNASGTGTAQGTTAANAGTVWTITSQRDLTDTFGTPIFVTDNSGNPVHGSELNEYGLQAAYSYLGASSRAYVVRADVDLSQLSGSTSVPTGQPVSGTYWVDTADSLYGINEWNASGSGSFTVKTPAVIINNDNTSTSATLEGDVYVPNASVGSQGDYAMVVTSNNTNQLYYKNSSNAWVLVQDKFDGGKSLQVSPHYDYPNFTTSTHTGSVWVKTTTPGYGANWVVKYYNGSTSEWASISAPIYSSTRQALEKIDLVGGGKNIPVGTLFIESNYDHTGTISTSTNVAASFKIWRRQSTSPTTIISSVSSAKSVSTSTFTIRESLAHATDWSAVKTVTIHANSSTSIASLIPAAVSAAGFTNISASYDAATTKVTIKHALGGDFEITDGTNYPLGAVGFDAYNMATKSGTANLYTAPSGDGDYDYLATNWKPLTYVATTAQPSSKPVDGTLWYDANLHDVDIMINDGTTWRGYGNVYENTDSTGPIIAALAPTAHLDGGDLVDGDIWVSTADTESYGKDIYVYNGNSLTWVLQDVTDHTSPNGWLFSDARWSTSGTATVAGNIQVMLTSDYLDPDAPDPALYPKGTRLWNTRRSGFNVKKYRAGYIDINANLGLNIRYENDNMSGYNPDRWVSLDSLNEDGSGRFGRHAQRAVVVSAFKSLIDTNSAVRDTDTLVFNLIATPGYPEAIQNMIAFNVDRGQTAFIVGDTPFRLQPTGTALAAWGNNTANAFDNGDQGAVSYDNYMAMFYPSGYANDNTGANIVVPPSHMMLRTIANSDAKSYVWFAPAGIRRGGVDNATSVGYLDSVGEFKTVALHESLRDVMATIKVNSIATIPGVGIVNYAQYTRANAASAMDRINVVRLIAYLRRQLDILAKPFLFEPNDAQTRAEIKAAAESLMLELVAQRALYDYLVVCDTSNNTPARIDRSELWMDIAIEPVKAAEFIYIPLRILNTGAIAAGNLGSNG